MGSSQAAGLEPQGGKPEGKAALLPDGSRFIGWLSTNLLSKFHVFGYCVGEFFLLLADFSLVQFTVDGCSFFGGMILFGLLRSKNAVGTMEISYTVIRHRLVGSINSAAISL